MHAYAGLEDRNSIDSLTSVRDSYDQAEKASYHKIEDYEQELNEKT